MIHVVKLKKTIHYEVRYDEDFEGEHEEMTEPEAVTSAKDNADECVFLSWDDSEHETVVEDPWELVSHAKKEGPLAIPTE